MKKWYVEVVKDTNGKYHANMMIDGKVVDGLLTDVDYKMLREDIKNKTGIEILKHDDMWWFRFECKDYAYIDATQSRLDCRVHLAEVCAFPRAWRPAFDGNVERIGKQVVLGPYTYVDDFKDIYVDIGTVVEHKPGIIGEMCACAGNDIVHLTERLFIDGRRESIDNTNVYYEQETLYDGNAHETGEALLDNMNDVIERLKEFPLKEEPFQKSIEAFFDVMNFEALSNAQLVFVKDIAEKLLGPQSNPVSNINKEMIERFKKQNSIDSVLSNAIKRSVEIERNTCSKDDYVKEQGL